MAVCTPQALLSGAACMDCPPDGWRDIIAISQLVAFSGYTGGPSGLAAARGAYGVFTGKNVRAAVAYLLASNGGYSTSPSVLLAQAGCLVPCLTSGQRKQVEMYLWGLNNGAAPTASSLMKAAAPYQAFLGSESSALLYLLDSLDGGNNPKAAMAGATCISCALNQKQIDDVIIYLLCQGLGANLVPPGSTYGPTMEFDIAISPNTYYRITWGSNEVSATVCGNTYPSTGSGTQTVFFSSSCALLQLFGNSTGTSVTAIVIPVHNVMAAPTGFSFSVQTNGTVKATWDSPPSGVSQTELWTSTDGVTYSLAATVAAPGTTASLAGPGASVTLYGKVRWIYPAIGTGPFTKPLAVYGIVADWAHRVTVNGGPAVSVSTVQAASTFVGSLISTTVWSKLKILNFIAPDSLYAAFTPLIVGGGADPWTTDVALTLVGPACLTVNGYNATGDTGNHWMNTGLIPSSVASFNTANMGMSIYAFTLNIEGSNRGQCGITDASGRRFQIDANDGSNATAFMINDFGTSNAGGSAGTTKGAGFYSMNRTAANTLDVYFAKSTSAFADAFINHTGTNVTAPPTGAAMVFCGYINSGARIASLNTFSFCATHDGLTSSEAQTLFNAVQSLRQNLGGGFL